MALYFDSNAGSNGVGTDIDHPKNSLAGLGSGLITEANCDLFFKAGSTFNVPISITNQNGYTNNRITIQKYGSGANPLLYSSQVATSHTWQEVSLASIQPNSTAVVASPGSHLWHRPVFIGSLLFGDANTKANPGTHWGQLRGYTIDGSPDTYQGTFPTADYHMANVIVGGVAGVVVWTANSKDPIDYYGITYSQTLDSIFKITQPRGGLEISGVDFGHSTQYAIDIAFQAYNRLCGPIILRDFSIKNNLGMRIGSSVTNRNNNVGTVQFVMKGIYAENIGNSFIGTWAAGYNAAYNLNNTEIYHNVINGVCRRFSLGGIYLLDCCTNDGSKIRVYENSVSGAMRDNVWPDGYAIYTDFSAEDVEIYRNYVWDCDLAYRNNGVVGDVRIYGNVAVAKSSGSPSSSAFGSNDPNDVDLPAKIELAYNVAVGFNKFAGYQDVVPNSKFYLHHNVSIGRPGGLAYHAVDVRGPSCMLLDSNNFFGYGTHLHDYESGFDGAAGDLSNNTTYITNKITSDPTAALAKINLTPTDPTVNYALTLPDMHWSGTPSYDYAPCFNPA